MKRYPVPQISRHRGRRRRSRFPLVLLAVVLLLAGAVYDSNHHLSVERYTIPLPDLPPAFDGLRLVQLSDLHGASFGRDNTQLLRAVRAAEPDMILLTGDLLDSFRATPQSYALDLAAELVSIAPAYFITGNHEWALPDVPALKEGLASRGVTVLSNQFVSLERGEDRLLLAGIDDPNGYADQKTPETLAEELGTLWPDACWLLLAHRNDQFAERYSLLGADLVISGHGHGGLVRLPFTDGLLSTDRTFFPTYTNGVYHANGSTLFVSRGLGNSGRTFRLFNRPQLAVLTLTRG